jgi:hypothetical protein
MLLIKITVALGKLWAVREAARFMPIFWKMVQNKGAGLEKKKV